MRFWQCSLTRVDAKWTHVLYDDIASDSIGTSNAGDWKAYGSLFAEPLFVATLSLPGVTRGKVRVQLVQGIINPFPGRVVEVQRSFGKGDRGCLEVLFSGTHTVAMPGPGGTEIPPTQLLAMQHGTRFVHCKTSPTVNFRPSWVHWFSAKAVHSQR
jgi:hypothetical protein